MGYDPVIAEAYETGYRAGQLAMRERAATYVRLVAEKAAGVDDRENEAMTARHIEAWLRALEPEDPT